MSTPKNFITSGISKKLLTPCRRIGLSRSKKTRNTIKGSPLTTIQHTAVDTPNKNVDTRSGVGKKCIELEETPKKPSPRQVKKLNSKIVTKTIENKMVQVDERDNKNVDTRSDVGKKCIELEETPKKPPRQVKKLNSKIVTKTIENKMVEVDESCKISDNCKIASKPRSKSNITPRNKKKSSPNVSSGDSPIQDVASNILISVEVHQPVAKRSINFNMIDEHSSITNVKDDKIVISSKPSSQVTSEGTSVQERSILNLEKEPVTNRKRKFRLESDDFTIESNEKLLGHNSPKTSISPKHTIHKYSSATSNKSSSGITLGRFTTEDYLKEYSSNPKNFQENLGEGQFVVAAIRNNKDIEAFSSSLDPVRSRKLKSKDADAVKDCLIEKQYVAILCPSVDQSANLKHSSSIKKSSLKLKKVSANESTTNKPNLKQKLTVSLERMPKVDIKCKTKADDKPIQQLPSINSKTTHFKISNFDEDDDELFTSSPENDKKQRENLLKLVRSIEIEISQKQVKLEKLNQAQVYKIKHSPEKLKVSSDRWLEGCRAGINDLLLKMQEHGPINMDTLTKKLRIPDEILEKLKL